MFPLFRSSANIWFANLGIYLTQNQMHSMINLSDDQKIK